MPFVVWILCSPSEVSLSGRALINARSVIHFLQVKMQVPVSIRHAKSQSFLNKSTLMKLEREEIHCTHFHALETSWKNTPLRVCEQAWQSEPAGSVCSLLTEMLLLPL